MQLTVKQTADRLGVHPSLVYRLIAAHLIEHERIGIGRGVIRISEKAVEEYLRRVPRSVERLRTGLCSSAKESKPAKTQTLQHGRLKGSQHLLRKTESKGHHAWNTTPHIELPFA